MTGAIVVGGFNVIKNVCRLHQAWLLVGKPCSRMIKHFFKARRLGLVWAALPLLLCLPANGGAYLPAIGPVPMRFEAAAVPAKILAWIPSVADKPAAPAVTNLPPAIPAVSTEIAGAIPPMGTKADSPGSSMPENLSTNSPPEAHSAGDLLVVTPEMLVDYFKPGSDATNQTNVRVVTPVGFMPPPSVASPSSQASYRSQ
jgi:hypothetical protein